MYMYLRISVLWTIHPLHLHECVHFIVSYILLLPTISVSDVSQTLSQLNYVSPGETYPDYLCAL